MEAAAIIVLSVVALLVGLYAWFLDRSNRRVVDKNRRLAAMLRGERAESARQPVPRKPVARAAAARRPATARTEPQPVTRAGDVGQPRGAYRASDESLRRQLLADAPAARAVDAGYGAACSLADTCRDPSWYEPVRPYFADDAPPACGIADTCHDPSWYEPLPSKPREYDCG